LLAFRVENRKDLTFKWNIYTIELNSSIFSWQHKSPNQLFPAILRGEFEITEVGDTYLDMSGFVKGYVWINGRLLGRYWNIGPQQRLYCPGVWLRKGENTLIIVELLSSKISNLRGY
jgi:beta-galactosidase